LLPAIIYADVDNVTSNTHWMKLAQQTTFLSCNYMQNMLLFHATWCSICSL